MMDGAPCSDLGRVSIIYLRCIAMALGNCHGESQEAVQLFRE